MMEEQMKSGNTPLHRFLRVLVMLLGIPAGISVAQLLRISVTYLFGSKYIQPWMVLVLFIVSSVVCTVLFWVFSQSIIYFIRNLVQSMVRKLLEVPFSDLLFGAVGLLLGLLIASMVSSLFDTLPPWISVPISVLIFVLFGSVGMIIGVKRWHELPSSITRHLHRRRKRKDDVQSLTEAAENDDTDEDDGFSFSTAEDAADAGSVQGAIPKVLDTSVIIDGRIYDVCKTGFLEGPLIVAEFMLKELRHIADASDTIKRNRGRRGLEVLGKMQKELDIAILVDQADFDDVEEVDTKLLKLARLRGGCVVTNDYNLNKVAEVSGIRVLNLNDLANAVKPVAMAGEEMRVEVIREGKEMYQGVGYLEDGTMIVIENGRALIGSAANVVVTSVLQTSAGRMIFAKPKETV